MDVRLEQGLLCARVGGRIPKVCLLCGATKDVGRRTQEYAVGASYGTGAGAAGGVFGAIMAQSLRNVDRTLAVGAIVSLLAVVSVGAYIAHRLTPRVAMRVPLCGSCESRWAEAEARRIWYLLGLVEFLVLVLAGLALDATALMIAGMLVLIALVTAAKITDQAERFAQVGFVKKDEIGFRVSKEIAEKMIERAQRRADKGGSADEVGNGGSAPDREAEGDASGTTGAVEE
ncbi:MAG: hypothetical protein U0353_26015 [Sandaracinus sp.]